MKVYLDDLRPAPDGWVRAHRVEETIDFLNTGEVTHLSLDFSLDCNKIGNPMATGYDVLSDIMDKLEANPAWEYPIMTVHSTHPTGADYMRRSIAYIQRTYPRDVARNIV